MKNTNKLSTKTLVLGAILTALVIVLQLLGSFIRFGPFSISLVLIPIVVGAVTCGTGVGTWLGLVFGVAVLLSGDAAAFMAVSPMGTVVTVLLKGALCGLFAGLAYNLVFRYVKNTYIGVLAAAIVCPVVNTGVFLLGCLAFFVEAVTAWAEAAGMGANVGQYMIVGLVGINFLVELISNLVLSSVATRLINIRKK